MLFNSFEFLFFFPVSIIAYFLTPFKYRWVWLLFASYFFYGWWKVEYIVLIALSTVIDYFAAIGISQSISKRKKQLFLVCSLFLNLGLLFFFKYFNFFSLNVKSFSELLGYEINAPVFDLLLPVGISFYTFQTISYTIDVYKGVTKAERHLGIFAVYVSFWPQLVAGPIERSNKLLPQFRVKHEFNYDRFRSGMIRIAWGYFKKLVIADRMAILVNEVYTDMPDAGGGMYILATVFFAFQIYCDFSGYSDIAIGSARIMGYELMENFNKPYFATTIQDFWSRWHISLSSWFKDYVYIPLGGNRVVKWRWYYNLFITFLISGFWHGANWTFIIWGAYHGVLLIIPLIFKIKIKGWYTVLPVFLLVCFGWLFFRANNTEHAFTILKHIFSSPLTMNWVSFDALFYAHFLMGICFITMLIFIEYMLGANQVEELVLKQRIISRWTIYIFLTLIILWCGIFSSNTFIYFQF